MINCIPEESHLTLQQLGAFFLTLKAIVSQGVTERRWWEDGKKEDMRWTRCGKGNIYSRWCSPNRKLHIPKPDLKFNKLFSQQTFWLVTVRNRGVTHNMSPFCSIVPVSHTHKHNTNTMTRKQLHSDVINCTVYTCTKLQCNNRTKKMSWL